MQKFHQEIPYSNAHTPNLRYPKDRVIPSTNREILPDGTGLFLRSLTRQQECRRLAPVPIEWGRISVGGIGLTRGLFAGSYPGPAQCGCLKHPLFLGLQAQSPFSESHRAEHAPSLSPYGPWRGYVKHCEYAAIRLDEGTRWGCVP